MFNSNDVCIGVLVLIGFIVLLENIPKIIKAIYRLTEKDKTKIH